MLNQYLGEIGFWGKNGGRTPVTLKALFLLTIYSLVTYVFFIPISIHPATTLLEGGDSLLNVSLLFWTGKTLLEKNGNYYQIPMFYPRKQTLLYSEPFFMQAPLSALGIACGFSPVMVHNLLLLISFPLAGLAMAKLSSFFSKSFFASVISGFIYAFSAIRLSNIQRVQVEWTFWTPMVFYFLLCYVWSGKKRDIFFFSLVCIAQLLSFTYFLLMLPLALGIFIICIAMIHLFTGERKLLRRIVSLALALLICMGIAALFFQPYLELPAQGFQRHADEIERYSLALSAVVRAAPGNLLWSKLQGGYRSTGEGVFPGVIVVLLLCIGVWRLFVRMRAAQSGDLFALFQWRMLSCFMIMGVLTLFFATPIGHELLRLTLFPFNGIRAVVRWVLLTYMVVALICVVAVDWFRISISRGNILLLLLVACTLIAETWYSPISSVFVPPPREFPRVYHVLAQMKPKRPLLELPIVHPASPNPRNDFTLDTKFMYFATYHGHHLFNGYSGFIPQSHRSWRQIFAGFPSRKARQAMKELGISRVLIHGDLWPELFRRAISGSLKVRHYVILYQDRFDVLLELRPDEHLSQSAPAFSHGQHRAFKQ